MLPALGLGQHRIVVENLGKSSATFDLSVGTGQALLVLSQHM
jgi:hypothetical protein